MMDGRTFRSISTTCSSSDTTYYSISLTTKTSWWSAVVCGQRGLGPENDERLSSSSCCCPTTTTTPRRCHQTQTDTDHAPPRTPTCYFSSEEVLGKESGRDRLLEIKPQRYDIIIMISYSRMYVSYLYVCSVSVPHNSCVK